MEKADGLINELKLPMPSQTQGHRALFLLGGCQICHVFRQGTDL